MTDHPPGSIGEAFQTLRSMWQRFLIRRRLRRALRRMVRGAQAATRSMNDLTDPVAQITATLRDFSDSTASVKGHLPELDEQLDRLEAHHATAKYLEAKGRPD